LAQRPSSSPKYLRPIVSKIPLFQGLLPFFLRAFLLPPRFLVPLSFFRNGSDDDGNAMRFGSLYGGSFWLAYRRLAAACPSFFFSLRLACSHRRPRFLLMSEWTVGGFFPPAFHRFLWFSYFVKPRTFAFRIRRAFPTPRI